MKKLAGLAVIAVLMATGFAVAEPVTQEHMTYGALVLRVPGSGAIPANYGNGGGGRWGCYLTCGGVPCLVGGKYQGFDAHPNNYDKFMCNSLILLPGFEQYLGYHNAWLACPDLDGNGSIHGHINISKSGVGNATCGG